MDWQTPDATERAFYNAFVRQDLDAMMEVWADDRPVFCIHPGGMLLSGLEEVEQSWQQIFLAEIPFRFDLVHHGRQQFDGQFSLHQLSETLYLRDRSVGVIQVSNGYCATPKGWRMVLHHASPQPESDTEPEARVVH